MKGLILHDHEVLQLSTTGKVLVVRPLKIQPKFPFGVKQIILIKDPWHDEAFEGTPAAGMGNKGPRELQWHCEDFSGNLVARWNGKCPYTPIGTQFFVKEPFYCDDYRYPNIPVKEWSDTDWRNRMLYYAVDGDICGQIPECDGDPVIVPAPRMPQRASRFTVETDSVAVKRVQEMSVDELRATGDKEDPQTTWNRHNPKHPWAGNPWAWFVIVRKV